MQRLRFKTRTYIQVQYKSDNTLGQDEGSAWVSDRVDSTTGVAAAGTVVVVVGVFLDHVSVFSPCFVRDLASSTSPSVAAPEDAQPHSDAAAVNNNWFSRQETQASEGT